MIRLKNLLFSLILIFILYNSVNATPSIGGRIHLEDSYNLEDKRNSLQLRRLRLTVSDSLPSISENLSYYVDIRGDKGGKSTITLGEAFVSYDYKNLITLKGGQITPLMSIFYDKSSNTNAFNSGGLSDDIQTSTGFDLLQGCVIESLQSKYGIQVGVFSKQGNENSDYDNVYRYTSRIYFTPVNNDNFLIHLGGGLFYDDSEDSKKLNENKDSFKYYRYSGDIALQYKFITLSYLYTKSDGSIKNKFSKISSDTYKSNDMELVINLTGEKTEYDSGIFHYTIPSRSFGAIQLGLRYSDLENLNKIYNDDLSITDTKSDISRYSIALSYIKSKKLRFVLDYTFDRDKRIHKDIDKFISFQTRVFW